MARTAENTIAPARIYANRLKAFQAYIAFMDKVPIGRATIGWDRDLFAWNLCWDGKIAGERYFFREMIGQYELENGRCSGEELGQRLAERWQFNIEYLTRKKLAELAALG